MCARSRYALLIAAVLLLGGEASVGAAPEEGVVRDLDIQVVDGMTGERVRGCRVQVVVEDGKAERKTWYVADGPIRYRFPRAQVDDPQPSLWISVDPPSPYLRETAVAFPDHLVGPEPASRFAWIVPVWKAAQIIVQPQPADPALESPELFIHAWQAGGRFRRVVPIPLSQGAVRLSDVQFRPGAQVLVYVGPAAARETWNRASARWDEVAPDPRLRWRLPSPQDPEFLWREYYPFWTRTVVDRMHCVRGTLPSSVSDPLVLPVSWPHGVRTSATLPLIVRLPEYVDLPDEAFPEDPQPFLPVGDVAVQVRLRSGRAAPGVWVQLGSEVRRTDEAGWVVFLGHAEGLEMLSFLSPVLSSPLPVRVRPHASVRVELPQGNGASLSVEVLGPRGGPVPFPEISLLTESDIRVRGRRMWISPRRGERLGVGGVERLDDYGDVGGRRRYAHLEPGVYKVKAFHDGALGPLLSRHPVRVTLREGQHQHVVLHLEEAPLDFPYY